MQDDSSAPTAYDTNSKQPPSMPQLESLLQAEFARLGIDPAKVAAAAPSGAENAVFDLSASLIDPDGPPDGLGGGELPPTGIQLKWTERHQGDYDGNGIVAVNDLTPIGLQFQQNVSYDAPALHGGLKYFPGGDPDDSSGGASSGAANWALARVDGNADGKITVQDLTPIAVHYQQRIYGYRVYRRAPSDSGFVLQDSFSGPTPSPGGEDSYVTVKHPASVPANQPVRYDYENSPDGGGSGEFEAGVYHFFVTSWDSVSNTEGQRSPTLSIDIQTGQVNQGPVANLTVTPDFAGAPAVITLDASQSVDFDGSITDYRWDLDGDGTVDYSTLDLEPPEQSSSGKVVEITPGETPAELSAKFIQPSEAWYAPTVRVVDSDGLVSSTASDQLGISGWIEDSILDAELDEFDPEWGGLDWLVVQDMCLNPVTGQLYVAGIGQPGGETYGVYIAGRNGDGTWTVEKASGMQASVWYELSGNPDDSPTLGNMFLAWGKDNQPVIVTLGYRLPDFHSWVFMLERQVSGNWSVSKFFTDDDTSFTGTPRRTGFRNGLQTGTESFSVLCTETIPDPINEIGEACYVVNYTSGSADVEDMDWSSVANTRYAVDLRQDKNGIFFALLGVDLSEPFTLEVLRKGENGIWLPMKLDSGSLEQDGEYLDTTEFGFDLANKPVILGRRRYGDSSGNEEATTLWQHSGSSLSETELAFPSGPSTYSHVRSVGNTVALSWSKIEETQPDTETAQWYLTRVEHQKVFTESLFHTPQDYPESRVGTETFVGIDDYHFWCIGVESEGRFDGPSGADSATLLLKRVDPRSPWPN